MNTKAKGDRTELRVTSRLIDCGYTVLKPYGDNNRYDIAVDLGTPTMVRIQCKTGHLVERMGAIEFATCSSYAHRGRGKKDYRGEAELFAVAVPELEKVYIVPVEACGLRSAKLRLLPSANRQRKHVRPAQDYELQPGTIERVLWPRETEKASA